MRGHAHNANILYPYPTHVAVSLGGCPQEAIAALQSKVEEQEQIIAELQNRIKLHEQQKQQRAGLLAEQQQQQ